MSKSCENCGHKDVCMRYEENGECIEGEPPCTYWEPIFSPAERRRLVSGDHTLSMQAQYDLIEKCKEWIE